MYATRDMIEEMWGAGFITDLLPADVDVEASVNAAAGQFIAQDNRRWVGGIANAIAYFCWVAMVFIAINAL